MVNGALIGTTEFDIFSLDPATCDENWRTHEDYPPALLPANRGAAYMDGLLFRGTQDGRVLAYDFKTGKRVWEHDNRGPETSASRCRRPRSPGTASSSSAMPAATSRAGRGTCLRSTRRPARSSGSSFWFPSEGDAVRGPQGATPLDMSTWKNAPGIPISGGGTWTSYTLDPETGLLYVPGGNPAPDFAIGVREGENLLYQLDRRARRQDRGHKNHFKLVPKDWHDWDVSNPPALIQTMGGKKLMAVAPKDGYLYGFDLADNSLLYRVPVTRIENAAETFAPGKDVHFCPGAVGGAEWNSPAYDPPTNLIMIGEVDWCDTVTLQNDEKLRAVTIGQPWVGMATLNPFNMFGKERVRRDTGPDGSTPSTPTPASGSGG